MNGAVKTPHGYTLLTEGVDGHVIYSFEHDGRKHGEWYTWKLGAIDAMWDDVRARAVREALPSTREQQRERGTKAYANGYLNGKQHRDAECALLMARAGYSFDRPQSAADIVKMLLTMLA
jgi:hypothetical protein